MRSDIHSQLLQYLQEEFAISGCVLEKMIRLIERDLYLLPIALWQYEQLTIRQRDYVYDRLATALKENALEKSPEKTPEKAQLVCLDDDTATTRTAAHVVHVR